jgi:tRNA-modifying protein YgfZ
MDSNVSGHFEGACRLHDWGVIRVRGEDAARFLHGQLSNDMEKLGPDNARLAAYCTAQGRMLASFVACRHGTDEVWLACSTDVLAATLKRLSMFVLRAKARLDDAGAELAVLGWAGQGTAGPSQGSLSPSGGGPSEARTWGPAHAREALPPAPWGKRSDGAAEIIRLPDAAGHVRALRIGPADEAQAWLATQPALPPEHWRWLEVRSGVARVTAATSGQFVPQMLNYELVGGVDFKKGCYPGQEIVARSQYLGKLKRRAFLLHGEQPMQAGQEVFWSGDEGQPAGMVALDSSHPTGGHDAIVELKSAVLAEGSLHLGAAHGPRLQPLPLPYALPADAASAA